MKRSIVLLLIFHLPLLIYAQRVTNIDVRLDGSDLILNFDLKPKESVSELYNVSIFSSKDNYQVPIKIKSGKTTDVRPGNAIQVVIDAAVVFANFEGELDFNVRATLVYAPLSFAKPYGQTFKKGNYVDIAWRGGLEKDAYQLDLYKGDEQVQKINASINTRSYLWNMPGETKPGKYKLRVQSVKDPNNSAVSAEFVIKRKIPLAVKILPLFVITGVVIFSGGEDTPTTTTQLPEPPQPPSGN